MKRIWKFIFIIFIAFPVKVEADNGWQILLTSPSCVGGIWGISQDDFYVAGSNIISHFDGSKSIWTTAYVDEEAIEFTDLWGSDSDNIYAVGRVGPWDPDSQNYNKIYYWKVLHYDGSQWKTVLQLQESLDELWVTSTGNVFILHNNNESNSIIYMFDGNSWETTEAPPSVHGLWASSSSDIFLAGEDKIFHFDGSSWHETEIEGVSSVGYFWGTSDTDIYASARDENDHIGLIHFDGTSWAPISFLEHEGWIEKIWHKENKIYEIVGQNGGWYEVWVYDMDGGNWYRSINTAGWLSHIWGTPEPDGPVYVAGKSWVDASILFNAAAGLYVHLPDYRFFDIWGADDQHVFLGGRLFMMFDGSNFHEISTPETDYITGIWGTGADNVYLSGWNGLYRYQSGLVYTIYGRQEVYFSDIWGTDSNNIYLSGWYGIFHWDGSYGTWVNNTEDLNAIWGSGGDDIFAVGDNGKMLHFDGSSWAQMESGTDEDLYDVWGSGPNDVYAVGSEGTVLHYDGTSWSKINVGTRQTLEGVWGAGPDDVFVGGTEIVLHYDGVSWSNTILRTVVTGFWGDSQGHVYAAGNSLDNLLMYPYGETLTVNLQINGMGKIGYSTNSNGSYCDTDCSFDFNLSQGGYLYLYADPADGYIFSGWGGNCSECKDDSCNLYFNSDINCFANFQPNGPPVIDAFTVQPETGASLLTVLFKCKLHDLDANDTVESVMIHFGDGTYHYETQSLGSNVTLQIYHTYAESGTYDAYCEASDQYDHRTESDHKQITVSTGPRIDLGIPIFSEEFSQGIRDDWEIIDRYGDQITWGTNDTCRRDPGSDGFTVPFALVDYGCAEGWAADDSLLSPEIALEDCDAAPLILSFSNYLVDDNQAVSANVDISTDNGMSWTSILHTGHSDIGPGTVRLDLSPFVSDASSLRLRYHYYLDLWGRPNYWLIDNVSILSAVDSIEFGTVGVEEESDPVTLVVKNTGSEDLEVQSLSLEGAALDDFHVIRDTCPEGDSFSLQPGHSCSVSVTFAPTAGGDRNAQLTIVSNDFENPNISLRLAGEGASQAEPPQIDVFTVSPRDGEAPLDVTLTCEAHDPDGGVLSSIVWYFGDSSAPYYTSGDNSTISHTYDAPGTYEPYCMVWDDEEQNATSDYITITVNAPIVNYVLDVGLNPEDGGTVTGNGINCPGDCSETYEEGTDVTLTATPGDGYQFSSWSGHCEECEDATCTITMNADKTCTANFELIPNELPVIESLTASPDSGDAPLDVSFTCEAHDPDGYIESYGWDFDWDGTVDDRSETGSISHTYENPGSYQVTCIVTDNDGETVESEPVTVTVESPVAQWQDITGLLNVTHSTRQLYDRIHRCFFIQVTVENPGDALSGPIRLVITDPSIPVKTGVEVGLEPDGYTEDGDPYFIIVPEEGNLDAGEILRNMRINFELQRKHLTYGIRIEQLGQ